MRAVLLVAVGGALGALARYAVATLLARRLGPGFPWATLFINLSGCFLIALFLSAIAQHPWLDGAPRALFPIGFVGAYTTFSTYEWEIFTLLDTGRAALAFGYFSASNAIGFLAIAGGAWLGKRL